MQNKLFDARRELGLSLLDVHHKTGLRVAYLSDIERGHVTPRPDEIEKIAKIYELSSQEITNIFTDEKQADEQPQTGWIHQLKKLTGEMLHDAYMETHINIGSTEFKTWSEISEEAKQRYKFMARYLRQELSLCDGCGQQAPPLLEITDLNLCVECIAPKYDPKAIYQVISESPDGSQTLIEATEEKIVSDATETLKKLGWKEHTTMMKGWTFLDTKNIFHNAETLQELVTLTERAQLKTQPTIYYTVQLSKSGFPVRFLKDGKEYTFGSGFDDPGESSQVFQTTFPGHTLKYMDEEAFTAMVAEKLYKSPPRQYFLQYGDMDTDMTGSQDIANLPGMIAEYVEMGNRFDIKIWNAHFESVGTGTYIREKDETITVSNETGEAIGLGEKLKQDTNQYVLGYSHGEKDWCQCASLEALNEAMIQHLSIALPEEPHAYYIRILKNDLDIGFGLYIRTYNGIKTISESGEAVGLNDRLYELAFKNA